ncbi:MAG: UDP-N-acetylmuramoyl-tripeptide--D-alanyl-D-alanine ligase [Ignavibacteriae bacterium]|nr:UDP-N-acetylmuramoyl-tripeptide--D-alanyl-D-alanine ligase [Ignavibacteriota bacterium]
MISVNSILRLKCNHVNFEKVTVKNFFGVSIDSRKIRKGFLFFAIKGENADGHDFIAGVFKKGATAAVVNQSWYSKNKNKFKGYAFAVVKDTSVSLGELAKIHLKKFSIPVLFVGGSNGKTTTKDLIAAVLSRGYKVLKNDGNLNNHLGLPLTVLELDSYHNICVLEAGSNHFGEIEYLCKIGNPGFGIVTNIGREHLEFFKNINGVAKEEFTLFDYLKKTGGKCFLNLDDEYIRKYSSDNKPLNSFSYSYNFKSDVKAKFIKYSDKFEPVIEIRYGSDKISAGIKTFGKHSVFNALAAAAVGLHFGISLKEIKYALENFKQASSKRMEAVKYRGILIINDSYNSNPDSVKLGLETLKEYKSSNSVHLVIADMLELGRSSKKEHYGIGKLIKNMKFDNLYTFGGESKNIFTGAKGIKNNFYFENKENLSELLTANVKEGDVIYFKGSRGMKLEEVIEKFTNGFII